MVSSCCARGCTNRYVKGSRIKFFRIPKEADLRRKWLLSLRRQEYLPSDHARLCGVHFINGKPSRDPTNPDYIPSIFSFTPKMCKSQGRLKRKVEHDSQLRTREKRLDRNIAAHGLLDLGSEGNPPGIGTQTDSFFTGRYLHEIGVQTNISRLHMDNVFIINMLQQQVLENLNNDLEMVTEERNRLQSEINTLESKLEQMKSRLTLLEKEADKFEKPSVEVWLPLIKDEPEWPSG